MKKNNLLEAALLGSSSALGLNWIYDRNLLVEEEKKGSMIFRSIDHDLYKKASNSYDVYPTHQVGQLDFMGEVLYLFHMFYDYEKEDSLIRWTEYFYEYFKKGNGYNGYLEKYGIDFIAQHELALDNSETQKTITDHNDKQLVGLTFLLHLYEIERSSEKVNDSLLFARTLTSYTAITALNIMLYELLKKLDYGIKKEDALQDVIKLTPKSYQNSLKAAITIPDAFEFISNYAGVSCDLEQSLPLIFYIVKNSDSWVKGMELNATLGGASSARGIFVSALLSRIYEIPQEFKDKLYYSI